MGYKSYLLQSFDYSHENRFFRELDQLFKSHFSSENGDYIFIGNIGVEGHSLDAVFIKNGAIVVIDFKNYSGELTFSENGPWKLKTDEGKTIFVAGGKYSRNPYQQVNAYRFSLFKYLSNNEKRILETNHTDISWSHTNAIVLFHKKINFDINKIPPKIQKYFYISSYSNIVNDLKDIYSSELNLTSDEIINILKALNISENDIYDSSKEIQENSTFISVDGKKMDKIINLIPKLEDKSDKILQSLAFYNTMLSIERINEASVENTVNIKINWIAINRSNYNLNIEKYPRFLSIWLQNLENRFQKDLFISIDVQFDDLTVPLFYKIVQASDVENNLITLDFNDFYIYRPTLAKLELGENVIDEISLQCANVQTLEEKITRVKEYFDIELRLMNQISLALSNESIFSAQLQSEMNKWIKRKIPIGFSNVFNAILKHSPIEKKSLNTSSEIPLINISDLNSSQKHGLTLAFEQPLTVIAGPPGTGKSQLVTNIIANAVVRNEKVLFASKNNKAVDNVIQKLNSKCHTEYFLRLGSTLQNKDFIKTLENTIHKIKHEQYPDKINELNKRIKTLQQGYRKKRELNSLLKSTSSLEKLISDLKIQISQQVSKHEKWLNSLPSKSLELYFKKNYSFEITHSQLNELQRKVKQAQTNWLKKLSFNFFQKSSFKALLYKNLDTLPTEVKNYIDQKAPILSIDRNDLESFINHLNFIQEQKKNQEKIFAKKIDFKKWLNDSNEQLDKNLKQLQYIKDNESKFRDTIANIESGEIELGENILTLSINEKLRTASLGVIDTYKSYISNGIPWQTEYQEECSRIISSFLDIFNAISITALNIKKGFLQKPEIFDLLVIDEASQCDITSSLPLIYRAKRVVIIGDSLQLPHITSVNKFEQNFVLQQLNLPPDKYDYIRDSLYLKAERISDLSTLDSAFLDEHYRCHPDIINFCNENFYQVKRGGGLTIKTNAKSYTYGAPGIHWVDVKGSINKKLNVNMAEVEQTMQLLKTLIKDNPNASFGVTTPFKHQKEALIKAIYNQRFNVDILCDVIHRFQGDEKDIMIVSLVVTQGSKPSLSNFINIHSPYLLNVAVSRAKSSLFIVGNHDYCFLQRGYNNQPTLLSKLAQYVKSINN